MISLQSVHDHSCVRAGGHREQRHGRVLIAACSRFDPELADRNQHNILGVLQAKQQSRPSLGSSKSVPRKRASKPEVLDPHQHADTVTASEIAAASAHQRTDQSSSASAHRLSDSRLLAFERSGHLTMRSLLTRNEIAAIKVAVSQDIEAQFVSALQHRIRVLLPSELQITVHSKRQALQHLKRHAKELGFLQFFNLHRRDDAVKRIVTSQRLVSVAAQLLDRKRLRVYQDCVFLKEPGFTPTNWHSDLPLSPLDTNSFVTAWIPLRPLKEKGDTGLVFAEGSHRDIAAHAQGLAWTHDLSNRGYRIKSIGRMEVGDVSWHHGWLLHYSPPQPLSSPARMALAVSYFADGARTKQLQPLGADDSKLEDLESYAAWFGTGPGRVQHGSVARHEQLPLVCAD